MNWKIIILAFMVSWKSTYRVDGENQTIKENKQVGTREEAIKFIKDLPGWAWDIRIREIRKGRQI